MGLLAYCVTRAAYVGSAYHAFHSHHRLCLSCRRFQANGRHVLQKLFSGLVHLMSNPKYHPVAMFDMVHGVSQLCKFHFTCDARNLAVGRLYFRCSVDYELIPNSIEPHAENRPSRVRNLALHTTLWFYNHFRLILSTSRKGAVLGSPQESDR